jgi:hypothetical protein
MKVMYKGRLMSAYAIAKECGLSLTCVASRIKRGIRGDALGVAPHEAPRTSNYSVDLSKMDILPASRLAKAYGVSCATIYRRKRDGIPLSRPKYVREGYPDPWDIAGLLRHRLDKRVADWRRSTELYEEGGYPFYKVQARRRRMTEAQNDVNDFADNIPRMTDEYLKSIGLPSRVEAEKIHKEFIDRFDGLVHAQYERNSTTRTDPSGQAKLASLVDRFEKAKKAKQKWSQLLDQSEPTGINHERYAQNIARAQRVMEEISAAITKLEPVVALNKKTKLIEPKSSKPRHGTRGWSAPLDKEELKIKILEWGRFANENPLDEQAVRTLKYYIKEYKKLQSDASLT